MKLDTSTSSSCSYTSKPFYAKPHLYSSQSSTQKLTSHSYSSLTTGIKKSYSDKVSHLHRNEIDIGNLLYPEYDDETSSFIPRELPENRTSPTQISISDIWEQLPEFDPYEPMDFSEKSDVVS